MSKTLIREAAPNGLGKTSEGRHAVVTIITPGEGSSAIYPADVLEQAATDKIFHAGLHMFMDHADSQKDADYPVGKVGDVAAVLVEDARWTGAALEAKARIFDAFADELSDKQDHIGVSIRAYAEHDHKPGATKPTITRITEAVSVDFVTQAGRGGSFRIEESVRRAIAAGVSEATANQTRELLAAALKEAYGADRQYVWLRDYDDSVAWFEWETPDQSAIYQIGYTTADDGAITLSGEPVEVRQEITYVPVTAGQSEETQPKESNMPEISEKELSTLRETAARAEAAETAQAEAESKLAEQERAQVKAANETAAKTIVTEAFKGIDAPKTMTRLAATFPVKEDGSIDTDAFKSEIEEAAAEHAVSNGAGKPEGFGSTGTPNENELTEGAFFGGLGLHVKEA